VSTSILFALLCGLTPAPKLPAVPPLPAKPPQVEAPAEAQAPSPVEPAALPSPEVDPSRWSLSFETSYLFKTINNPFIFLIKSRFEGPNPLHYRLATQILSARYELTRPGGWSFLRGNWEASLGILDSTIIHGPEDYIVGGVFGLRYNFVPKGSPLSPFIEMRGVLSATNASHIFQGQQQDLTFGYLLSAGVRYQINDRWSASLSALTQHESDFFMTNPNFGFNALGVNAEIKRRF